MGIISVVKASNLLWLGRYSERVYTTLQVFSQYYDDMIDRNMNGYEEYCEKLSIPSIYTSVEDFFDRYLFDESDPNSIVSNLTRRWIMRLCFGMKSVRPPCLIWNWP